MVLTNGEFSLRGFEFGSKRTGYPITPGGFQVTPTEFKSQDEDNPLGPGILFGQDEAGHVTFTWDILVLREGPNKWAEADLAVNTFRALWRENVNRSAGQTEELHWYHGSEELLSYGRPRHFAVARGKLRQGVATITCDFICQDDYAYSLGWQQQSVGAIPASTGGLEAPLVAPLTAYGTGAQREGFINVAGIAPAPALIRIYGPVTNPFVELVGHWRVGLNYVIPEGLYVEIDARRQTALLGGTNSIAGSLTRTTPRLTSLVLPVGDSEFIYGGTDPTGTSYATILWREARYAI